MMQLFEQLYSFLRTNDVLIVLTSLIGALLAGSTLLFFAPTTRRLVSVIYFLLHRRPVPRPPPSSYSERSQELTQNLAKASSEVDGFLQEMAQVAQERNEAALILEQQLAELSNREGELKARIENLENVPLPVAEHFAALLQRGERRSKLRDYFLFGLGAVVTTVAALLVRLL